MEVQAGLAQRAAALRRRLDELAPLTPRPEPHPEVKRLQEVHAQLGRLQQQNAILEARLTDFVPDANGSASGGELPVQLAQRTRALLVRGRDLLVRLKTLSTNLPSAEAEESSLWSAYQQTVVLAELALRSVQTFPAGTSEQLRLCDGLDVCLGVVEQRTRALQAVLAQRQAEQERLETLAHHLAALVQGRPILLRPFQELAETLIQEAQHGQALRWQTVGTDQPERWAAAHALNTAQLMARLARLDLEWRGGMTEAVLVALLHDAGMAAMPVEVLCLARPYKDEQRRQIEAHVGLSAEVVRRLAPQEGWLVDVVRAHHERLDGTGYPTGMKGAGIPRLARLLAVCDVYAALICPRPHRAALTPRAALTETLLEAEKGRLDPDLAQHLLEVSFYPIGSLVELSDGQVGLVVATNPLGKDLSTPVRPVVQLLQDENGQTLPWPIHVNLAQCDSRHIVRSLTEEERRKVLGGERWYL
jgi:HD-GYP domain-containing protein (c-di-GMP phosphodiesterase class II)